MREAPRLNTKIRLNGSLWVFAAGGEMRRSRGGASGKTIGFFLTDRPSGITVFQN